MTWDDVLSAATAACRVGWKNRKVDPEDLPILILKILAVPDTTPDNILVKEVAAETERLLARQIPDVDTLAQIIRKVDGSHTLGAGILAEEIIKAIIIQKEQNK